MCGGTMVERALQKATEGLSPRVRGNRLDKVCKSCHPRSIPACAGEPLAAPTAHPREEVYPRVCGGTDAVRSASGLR